MAKYQFSPSVQGNYIEGGFHVPREITGEWTLKSPADFSDEIGKFHYSYASIDDAVHSSRKAFASWKKASLEDRSVYLKKYQAALKKHEAELAEIIVREVGKPLWEAKTEVATMVNKVDVTLNESLKLVSDFEIPKILENTVGSCRYRPLGVLVVVGPFNFPGHLPNGHIVPALLTGNTVIFKPSEKTPLTAQLMAQCFDEAGFPPGVFNLLQGEKEVGRRLCVHEGVDGILFTGSYEVGTRIKQDTLQQHWKLLALEMGGKNSAIVWKDASLENALLETLTGAFLTSGQRCSATSRILVHHDILDAFVERFHERSKAFSIGHPLDEPFMGPLVESGSVDRYLKFLGIAEREGFEVVMRGKALSLPYSGHYVTPSICLAKDFTVEQSRKSIYQQTELFAPNVSIIGINDLDEAIAQANVTQYGLVCSVFTQSRTHYDRCLEDLQMGLVNWNKATVGASSRLPFGGLKKSGNHFPTALSAPLYCTTPVASLEVAQPPAPEVAARKMPGLKWE